MLSVKQEGCEYQLSSPTRVYSSRDRRSRNQTRVYSSRDRRSMPLGHLSCYIFLTELNSFAEKGIYSKTGDVHSQQAHAIYKQTHPPLHGD